MNHLENIGLDALRAIPTTEVKSSNIARIGYDHDKVLVIAFHSGAIYAYYPITSEGYAKLRAADSIRSFFHKNIKKNPNIDYLKIND